MNKILNPVMYITASTFLMASVFELMKWPFAGILILLSFAFISLVFLPLLLIVKLKREENRNKRTTLTLGTINASIICITFLFKWMEWPGGNLLILISTGLIVLAFLPFYFIESKN